MCRKNNLPNIRLNILNILLTLAVLFLYGCDANEKNIPKALQGEINLSSWDFQKDGLAKLDGQWEIYYGQLLEPINFKSKAIDYFEVPNSFTNTVNNKSLPKYGYGTLRLKIKMDSIDNNLYGIKTKYLLTASKIWINNELVTTAGKVSKDSASAIGSFEPQIAFFKNDSDYIEIVIQMSNFNNVTGKVQSILLGSDKQIKRKYITSIALDALTIGCLFIMAIYHFALYYKRPKYKAPLYFGIFCLLIALRNTLVSERLIFQVMPNIPLSLFNKMAYLTVYTSLPFIVMFFKELFTNELSSKMVNVMNLISMIVSLITITTNIKIYDSFLLYSEIWILILFIYILFIIIKALINKTEGASIVLFGFIVFLISVIHDILLQAGLFHTKSLIPTGFLIFIFSQAYMLAAKFSNAYIENEKLLEENKSMYTDELTGILNRRGFNSQGKNLFNAALITGGKFTLFYGDLNKLKIINDSFGHKEGDEAIKITAKLLKTSFGKNDIVARISGDEFIIIAVNKASEDDARRIIDHINNNFHNYNLSSNKPYKLSISIGFSIYQPSVITTLDELINQADTMLYHHKSITKDSISNI